MEPAAVNAVIFNIITIQVDGMDSSQRWLTKCEQPPTCLQAWLCRDGDQLPATAEANELVAN